MRENGVDKKTSF